MPREIKITRIKIEDLLPTEENPNTMKDVKFNSLVKAIEEIGYDQPIKVWFNNEKGKYEIVKGSHRYWALKLLKETEVDCILGEYKDRDEMLKDMVRDNVVKGEMDPIKFTKLYQKIADKYGTDITRQMFAFLEDAELKRLIKEAKKQLPEELAQKLEEAKDDIKTIDDLSAILNKLFNEYGGTLPFNFMVFKYGKADEKVCYVKCDKETWKGVEHISKISTDKKVDFNSLLKELFFSVKTIKELE